MQLKNEGKNRGAAFSQLTIPQSAGIDSDQIYPKPDLQLQSNAMQGNPSLRNLSFENSAENHVAVPPFSGTFLPVTKFLPERKTCPELPSCTLVN